MQGRDFTDEDRKTTEQVAIVDDVLAHQYWPGQNPIGQHITINDPDKGPWITIVGLVKHSRENSLEADTNEGTYFLPIAQSPTTPPVSCPQLAPGRGSERRPRLRRSRRRLQRSDL